MFSTFSSASAASSADPSANSATPSGSQTTHRQPDTSNSLPARTKAKRIQVSRACDRCRVHRIKCDNAYPCRNCQAHGGYCSNRGEPQVRTLPQAFREIEKLRQRVKELEEELSNNPSASIEGYPTGGFPTGGYPAGGSPTEGYPTTTDQHETEAPSQQLITEEPHTEVLSTSTSISDPTVSRRRQPVATRRYWEGIYASPNGTQAKQFFGPSSLVYFIKRVEDFLATALQKPLRDHPIWFNSASKSFASPFPERAQEFVEPAAEPTDRGHREPHVHDHEQYLSTTQEEFFLGFFWQSYHNTIQIINEAAFREHYKSLCDVPGGRRRPSALVDIIIAICMQYGIALLPPQNGHTTGFNHDSESTRDGNQAGFPDVVVRIDDATIAGRWHYSRCQALLTAEVENPTITTMQCHIFSIIYLCNASFQTTAHSTLGLAVRTAQILGLHLEPPIDMPHADRELRKRIWWTLQTIEIKTCMKLGRPLITSSPAERNSLPSDDYQLALLSSSTTSVDGGVTWLTYTLQNTKLILAAHATHVAFFHNCDDLLAEYDCATVYEDHRVLEKCAGFLQESLAGPQGLHKWLQAVPDGLKSRRRDGGEAFSTDCSALDMEHCTPIWLQRHRLLLELLYHNLSINLFRPFIAFSFGPHAQTSSAPSALSPMASYMETSSTPPLAVKTRAETPLASQNARFCIRHAIALTTMIHEMLRDTDLLGGWHEAFQWQWNAALTLIGFILSDPQSDLYHEARRAVEYAAEVFCIFGRHFAVGTSASRVTRELAATADHLVNVSPRTREGSGSYAKAGNISIQGSDNTSVANSGMGSSIAAEPQSLVLDSGIIFRPEAEDAHASGSSVGIAIGNSDAVRPLLDETMNMAYVVDSIGAFEFSYPEASHFFEFHGWSNFDTGTGNNT